MIDFNGHRPTEAELRRAERAAWGEAQPTGSRLRLLEFRAVRRNSLRGFAEVKLPSGLIINDIVIGEANGRQWALLPSKPMVDRDGNLLREPSGKIRYSPVVEWGSAALRDEFSRRVVALVCAQYPVAFDGGPP
jgi:hypothetical protein